MHQHDWCGERRKTNLPTVVLFVCVYVYGADVATHASTLPEVLTIQGTSWDDLVYGLVLGGC